jgi:hypothetical protein
MKSAGIPTCTQKVTLFKRGIFWIFLASRTGVNPREKVRLVQTNSFSRFYICTILHYLGLHEHSFDLANFNSRKISFLMKKPF